ncbi:serine/threonine-protein kinase [Stigmatella aurantiaca]|uniref:Serine/threonine-protein kinase Pkn6 n=1 Tax=Stigmatella aurantiaca (strain DW4/3-1) TaxID=378806 RepID=Q08TZ8_STIAD|nr:serine/threonine-protein kinase [Stigmatella aurantiaca]EAU63940.1 serine/threonine-protein kinase Pkn6 [Stigmatella aurantiaca DW4/3-1]
MRQRQYRTRPACGLLEDVQTGSAKTVEVPSRRYGRYRLRSRLGEGGMAEVFLADAVDARGQSFSVALKLMRKDVPVEAFADEADLMGVLDHPNLVRKLEDGEAFGRPFIAIEFLSGGDLERLLRTHERLHRRVPLGVAVHVCIEVLRALAYFHQARTRSGRPLELVHGDITPSNIFFSGEGEVKLGDFGVAKSRGADIGPQDGILAGKLHYLSPEQTRGEPPTPATDLFALGIVLHEMVVGTHPFLREETDEARVMAAIRAGKLNLPDSVDRPLAQILRRALAPDTASRYHTAGEFAGALFTWLLDSGQSPSRPQIQEWLRKSSGQGLL